MNKGPVGTRKSISRKIHETMVILYVTDQKRSAKFYEHIFGIKPILDVPGITEFQIDNHLNLGLMPGDSIKNLLGDAIEHPFRAGNSSPRAELYLLVDSPEEWGKLAVEAGASLVSPFSERPWGDLAVYVRDPDANIIAFAERKSVS